MGDTGGPAPEGDSGTGRWGGGDRHKERVGGAQVGRGGRVTREGGAREGRDTREGHKGGEGTGGEGGSETSGRTLGRQFHINGQNNTASSSSIACIADITIKRKSQRGWERQQGAHVTCCCMAGVIVNPFVWIADLDCVTLMGMLPRTWGK